MEESIQTDDESDPQLETWRNADKIVFKPDFEARYQALLGDRYPQFIKYSLSFLRKALRVNTLKSSVDEIKSRLSKEWILTPVPWIKEGFYVEHRGNELGEKRRDVGNLPEHTLGYFYIQEPASMIPPLVLDPRPGERVLDMCASPGSKSSQIAMYMKNEGILVANEMSPARIAPLTLNLQRSGVSIAVVTRMDGRQITGTYDRVLVDAPCSGVGTIRKSYKTIEMWNPKMVTRLARIQLSLVNKAYMLLESGGVLVYSTCTLEPEENEGVVSEFLRKHPDMELVDIDLKLKRSACVREFAGEHYHEDIDKCIRLWPMDNDGEGFFIAKMRKK